MLRGLGLILLLILISSCRKLTDSSVSYGSANFPVFTFEINNNQPYTDQSQVTIKIQGELTNLNSYRVFRGSACAETPWLPIVDQFELSLRRIANEVEIEEGDHFISMQVKSKLEFESACVTKSIYFDKSPPLFAGLPISISSPYSNIIDASPLISWGAAFDAGSGVAHYKVALGSSPGETDIVGWTELGLVTSYQFTNLNLSHASTYYVSLRAVDHFGFASSIQSTQWQVDSIAPPVVSQLRHYQTTNLTSIPIISWEGVTDEVSGVSYYEIALGSTPGDTNIRSWQNIGNTNTTNPFTFAGVSMSNGDQFFPSLRAVDRAGNVSSVATSSGWRAINKWVLGARISGTASFFETSVTLSDGSRIILGNPLELIFKVTPQGAHDSQFTANLGSGFNGSYTLGMIVQDDEKLVVGGLFNSFNGISSNNIARLNSNGSFDPSFNIGTGFNGQVNRLAKLNGGKILVAGRFTAYQGVSTPGLAVVNADGSRDASFNIGSGFSGTSLSVQAIKVTANGRIYVGGAFTDFNGLPAMRLIRLLGNGSRDNGFHEVFDNTVFAIDIDSQGRIYVGGNFNYAGQANNRLVRFNPDGSLDTTFQTGLGFNATVRAIAFQEDGRIVVGGHFATVNGLNYSKLVRLNEDGSVDTTFNIGTGFHSSNAVYGIEVLPNHKIIVDGYITQFDGITVNHGVLLEW